MDAATDDGRQAFSGAIGGEVLPDLAEEDGVLNLDEVLVGFVPVVED